MRGYLSALVVACAALAAGLARAGEPDEQAPSTSVADTGEPDEQAPAMSVAHAGAPGEKAPSTIVVLCDPDDRFGLRVVAELEALSFRVVRIDPAAEPASRASLEATARDAGAIAAIRAVPSEHGVEVWIADRITGKTVLREMRSDESTLDGGGALAIRTVELLRASLLEVTLPAPPRGEVPVTPEIRARMQLLPAPAPVAPPKEPPPTLRLSVAPGALWSRGGFGPAVNLDIGIAWMASDHVGLTGLVAIPLSYPGIEQPQGRVELGALLAGGGVRFVFTRRASWWGPSVDLGVTAISLRLTGTGHVGFLSGKSSAATAAPFLRAGCAFAWSPRLRFRADLLASVIVQDVSIRIAHQHVATWGRPILLFTAGIDFGLL